MSIEAIAPSLLIIGPTPGARREGINWPFLLLFWVAISAFFVARAVLSASHVPLVDDTDDAMRLVVVRDFLAGQNWYDHLQYRMNTPWGADIHWSRLIDLPIAALILLFRPFAGASAENLTLYVWPLLQLLGLLWLSGAITTRLVGREGLLAALALPVLSPALWPEFAPGRLDHHGVQILLTLALVWCSIAALTRPRWAVGAGIAAASALAIGTEALPQVASAVLVFGLLWLIRPERADALRMFGLSLAGAALVHLAIALPPSRWLEPACDEISIVYVAAAVAVGVGFLVLSLLPGRRMGLMLRLAAATVAGLAVLGLLYKIYPDCFRGPYAALDPWLVTNWLDRIAEARPLWDSIAATPDLALGIAVPAILGLVVLLWRLVRAEPKGRDEWLVLGGYLAIAVVVMLVQVRGARLATPLAVPAGAWLIALVRARYLAGGLRWMPALVASWLAFSGVAVLLAVNLGSLAIQQLTPGMAVDAGPVADDSSACLMPGAFASLAALPPAGIMTPVDLGSHMLMFTPHTVVAAPYHRNQRGVRDAFDFFNGPIDKARTILAGRGVGLVVICPAMAELKGLPDASGDSFVRLYAQGRLPDWLAPLPLADSPLVAYRVLPGSGA